MGATGATRVPRVTGTWRQAVVASVVIATRKVQQVMIATSRLVNVTARQELMDELVINVQLDIIHSQGKDVKLPTATPMAPNTRTAHLKEHASAEMVCWDSSVISVPRTSTISPLDALVVRSASS